MRAYDMENVSMRRKGLCLSLEVPGLAEKRPSIVHGDHIFVRHACDGATAPAYEVMFLKHLCIISYHCQPRNFKYVSPLSGGIKNWKRFFFLTGICPPRRGG